MHIPDRDRCNWLREKIEAPTQIGYSKDRKAVILDRLMWGHLFEAFLSQKWTAAKRFGLEGCETLIPGLKEMIDRAADLGVESIVIGMPHRGRLNVLGNVVRKPLAQIFSEFSGGIKPIAEAEAVSELSILFDYCDLGSEGGIICASCPGLYFEVCPFQEDLCRQLVAESKEKLCMLSLSSNSVA